MDYLASSLGCASQCAAKQRPTCCELSLHLLEDGVLGCSLGPARQRLRGGAGEHGGHVGDVLQAHAEGADQLLDKVQGVRRDLGVGHGAAFLKGHRVALGQALLELPQHLHRHGRRERERVPQSAHSQSE